MALALTEVFETVYNTTAASRTSAAFDAPAGSKLYVAAKAGGGEITFTTLPTNSGTGLTWTQIVNIGTASATARLTVWEATVDTDRTGMTVTVTRGGSNFAWGMQGILATGQDAADATGAVQSNTTATTSAPSRAITTEAANSAVLYFQTDFNAVDGASRTYRTMNSITPTAGGALEFGYFRDASIAAYYTAYWNDAGAAGAKTVGISAPSGQTISQAAIEIKAGAGGGTTVERSAAIAATAAVTAAGTFFSILERTAALAGTAAIATAPQRDHLRSAAITATAGITSAQIRVHLRSASLAATGAVTAAPQRDHLRSAALTATAAVSATGQIEGAVTEHERSATLAATTAVAATGQRDLQRAATLAASSSITASGEFWTTLQRSAALTATGAVTSAPQRELHRTAALTASTGISATGEQDGVTSRSALLAATTSITVAHQRYLHRSASITATGLITASSAIDVQDTPTIALLYTETARHATHREASHTTHTETQALAHRA